jgi:hypothetical protein
MPQINVDDVVYHLDSEFKKALRDTFARFAPGVSYSDAMFTYFRQRVYNHCSKWETVPDGCVKE